jgi:hypothetical protein
MGNAWGEVRAIRGQKLPIISNAWKPLDRVRISFDIHLKETEAFLLYRGKRSRSIPLGSVCPACLQKKSHGRSAWILRRDVLPVCKKCWYLGVQIKLEFWLPSDINKAEIEAVALHKRLVEKNKGKQRRSVERAAFRRYRELIKACPGLICPRCFERKEIQVPKVDGQNKATVGRAWVNTGGNWRCRSCWNRERQNNGI